MKWIYIPLVVLVALLIVWLVKNWRQTIFRKRVAQALQNFQENTQAQIKDYFRSKKWRIPNNFETKLAAMEEWGLLSWRKGKFIVYRLTEPGKGLLPKPKVEVSAVTRTFDAKEFQRKPK